MYVIMKFIRKEYHCETCGSTDITFDASAYWNRRRQKFEYDIFENYCNHCGDIRRVNMVIHEYPQFKKITVL